MHVKQYLLILFVLFCSCSTDDEKEPKIANIQIASINIGSYNLSFTGENLDAPFDGPIVFRFSKELDISSVENSIIVKDEEGADLQGIFSFLDNNKSVSLALDLLPNHLYTIIIEELKGVEGEIFPGIELSFKTLRQPLNVNKILFDDRLIDDQQRIKDVSLQPQIIVEFSAPVNASDFQSYTQLRLGSTLPSITLTQPSDSSLEIEVNERLLGYREYSLEISPDAAESLDWEFEGLTLKFFTKLDSTVKFPEISDDEFLTLVQEQTFKYFWDFGHPTSGLARERNTSENTVTIGGSGFGVMTILVGIERGFITRQEGVDRLSKIVNFLAKADRFHGVWPHWMNGVTGDVVPFSSNDDGGDLVETAFMIQGLLTVRRYLNNEDPQEAGIIKTITQLWEEVEWDWYTQGGQNALFWHWSPNFGWEKNHKISGWNEALIVYVLAASSPTHGIDPEVYHQGWARNGAMQNGRDYYGINLPLGPERGGPLFFAHYSFLGLDPRNLEDQYANYWEQNVNHTLINHKYAVSNPKNYVGYTEYSWGLTASDGYQGYSAHSPTNDRGIITPTAAISSIPYSPEKSLKAMRHFYYIMGDKLWKEYGFADAFSPTYNWYASSFLAIDQGPIIIMIENYRTAMLWELFMADPQIANGLDKLGFTY